MAETSNGTVAFSVQSAETKIHELEQRYIELLESRISKLEQHLSTVEVSEPVQSVDKIPGPASVNHQSEDGEKDQVNNTAPEADGVVKAEELRYAVIVSKWNSESGDFEDTDITKPEEKKLFSSENQSRRAFTLRKFTMVQSRHAQNENLSSEVTIEFPPLQKLLGKVTSKYGWNEAVVSCSSPFTALIYAWEEASQEAHKSVENESNDERQARTDLSELLKIISTSSGHQQLDQYFKDRSSMLHDKTITHAALWTLFPPGTLIVSNPFLGEPQIFTVLSSDFFDIVDDTFGLVCFCFDWNGSNFERAPFEMLIDYWGPDRRSIVELDFYPLDYYIDPNPATDQSSETAIRQLKKNLIERGKKFVEYCKAPKGKQMFKYRGDALLHTGRSLLLRLETEQDHRSDESSATTHAIGTTRDHRTRYVTRKKIDGTTMVDFASFLEYLEPNTPILGNLARYEGPLESLSPDRRANQVIKDMYKFEWDKTAPGQEMTPDQYLHCPPRVLSYALKQKAWAQVLVERLEAPGEADATVFRDKLQLDDESKDLVKWSVQAHEKGKEARKGGTLGLQDFAPDKGKGLVIMLYGYPGVGKTLTAESVALMAGKPLLSVGVSDIGIEGDKVEANLQKLFDLAGKWEAVLLFDEADVFLEKRGEGENDLQRNAMVSVLLRVLEYYDGILILTTNRMRSFDIAVQSRIHIAIKYEELQQEQQKAIFKAFINQLHKKKLVHDYKGIMTWVEKDIKKFHFNGRQIRNVVSTAMGIALVDESGDEMLKKEHLVRVAEQTKSFKDDLKAEEKMFQRTQ